MMQHDSGADEQREALIQAGAELARREEVEAQREAEFAELRELARLPADNPNLVLRLAADGRVLYANRASEALLRGWAAAMPRNDLDAGSRRGRAPDSWREIVTLALAGGSRRRIDADCDGRVYTFDVVPEAHGGHVNLYGADVTELHTTRERLQAANQALHVRGEQLAAQNRDLERLAADLATERSRLEALIECAPEAIVLADAEGRIVLSNPAADRLYARPVPLGEEYDSHAQLQLCYPDGTSYDPRDLPLTRSALDGQTHVEVEMAISWPDGQRRDLLVNTAPVRDAAGRPVGAVGVFQDITRLKEEARERERLLAKVRTAREQAEASSAQAGRRAAELESVMATIPGGVAIFGPEGRLVHLNDVARKLFGSTPGDEQAPLAEWLDTRRYTFLDGRRVLLEETPHFRALQGGTVRNEVLGTWVGERVTWVSISAAPLRDAATAEGRVVGAVLSYVDVTELRQAQEALQAANEKMELRSEELEIQAEELQRRNAELACLAEEVEAQRALLDTIVEHLPVGIGIAEAPSGRLLRINEQTRRIWRLDAMQAADAAGYGRYAGFFPDGRPYRAEDWQLVRAVQGEVIHGEVVHFVRGDGSRGVMSSSAAPVRDPDGQIVAAIVVIEDITGRKEAEDALRRARDELEQRVRERTAELALANATLEERVEARTRELASMLSIAHHIASELELEPLLRLVLDEIEKLVGYTTLAVYAVEGNQVTILDYRGPLPRAEVFGFSAPLDSSFGLAKIVAERAPLLVSDVEEQSDLARTWRRSVHPARNRIMGSMQSWMALPLVARGRVIGILRLAHDRPGYYDEQKVQWGLALADQVAVAIDNARLYGQARELAILEERQRLARDLHDVVSQTLFSAGLTADVLPQIYARDPVCGQKLLDDLRRMNRGALAELRALLAELRPTALFEVDLGTLLTHLAEAAAGRSEAHITVVAGTVCPLPSDVQVALYRVAQEALHNVAKHAHAGRATVRLACTPGPDGKAERVELHIEDDGVGFDLERVAANQFGLNVMAARARAVGATLDIDSRPGGGTRVTAAWPAATD